MITVSLSITDEHDDMILKKIYFGPEMIFIIIIKIITLLIAYCCMVTTLVSTLQDIRSGIQRYSCIACLGQYRLGRSHRLQFWLQPILFILKLHHRDMWPLIPSVKKHLPWRFISVEEGFLHTICIYSYGYQSLSFC